MHRVTIAQPITINGIGLFGAQPVTITIVPGETRRGIEFDFGGLRLPAHIDALSTRPAHPAFARLKPRCTSVGDASHTIATIEHLMSALVGLGITDVVFEISADSAHAEVPILDGSAKPFTDAIGRVGLRTLDETVEPIVVRSPICIKEGEASIVIEPCEAPTYTYRIDYPGTPIGSASVSWAGGRDEYIGRVSPARTFSLEHEAAQMQAAGLFTHLTPGDMLVIGADGPIDNEFRLPDECARHKLLDLIGDLGLVGAPLIAKITATRSGHALAHRAARAIVDQHNSPAE